MCYKAVSILLFFLLTSTFSNAIAVSDPAVQIIKEDEYGLMLELTLPPFKVETFQTTTQLCHQVHIPNWGKTLESGYPELPVTSVLIQVPQVGEVTAYVTEKQSNILQNIILCPVSKQQVSIAGDITFQWIRNANVYQRGYFFPDSLVKVDSRGILRGVSVSRLRIFPFQWNPMTQELRYFNTIRFQVRFEQKISSHSFSRRGRANVSNVYESIWQKTILNYQGKHPSNSSHKRNQIRTKLPLAFERGVRDVSSTRHVKQHDALRIEITEEGIYKLSYQDLAKAGLQPQWMNPERFHLFHQEQEVAIQVVSQERSLFHPGDYIQFYAQGIDNTFTDTNVYWLYWRKKGLGKRMAQIDGSVTGEGEKIPAFYERLHFEQNRSFWLETPGAPIQDYQFWQRLNASDISEYTIKIHSPYSEPTEAIVRINFQGRSTAPPNPNHHTLIKLNGTMIGDEFWDGELPYTQEMHVSSTLFREGNNLLTIEMPGDTGAVVDVIYLNWIEIEYWQDFKAVKDSFAFSVIGNDKIQIMVNQLHQAEIIIYDITNPFEIAEITHFAVTGEKRNYQATFETLAMSEEKRYYISNTQQIKSPPSITPIQSANLKSSKNGADYILITAKAFLPAVQPLGELRRQQGLRVKFVSVEDIYNEFKAGLFEPVAIKEFLQYAYHNWNRPAPTYIFLVGDAHISYKKKNSKKGNQVPPHLSASIEGLTPDDNWYVSVDGDDMLPDMFIGRIPGNHIDTITALIDKIISFEQSSSPHSRKVLLVADSSREFEELNEKLFDYLPKTFSADTVYLRSYLTDIEPDERQTQIAQATQDIITSINNGVIISNYIGHGVIDRWSKAKGLFNPDDVHRLNNEKQLIFALMLTCINGYFVDDNTYSLAEEFLLTSNGAIGAYAPSNVSYAWEDTILANEVFSSIFKRGDKILGVITTSSKIAAYKQGTSQNVLQMFTLFGDPAVKLKDW